MSADSPEPPAGTRVPVPHAVNGGAPSGQRGRVVSQSYRGLPIYAAQGHHEECFAMLGPWLGIDGLNCANFKSIARKAHPSWRAEARAPAA